MSPENQQSLAQSSSSAQRVLTILFTSIKPFDWPRDLPRTTRRPLPTPPQAISDLPVDTAVGGSRLHSITNTRLGIDDLADEEGEGLPAYLEEANEDELVIDNPTGGVERVISDSLVPNISKSVENIQLSTATSHSQEESSGRTGDNTRFGRWRDWVEKRTSDRIDDDTDIPSGSNAQPSLPTIPIPPSYSNAAPQTHQRSSSLPVRSFPTGAQLTLLPTASLQRLDYGPPSSSHSKYPINCACPLPTTNLVLLGTTNELKV
ncbi:uncharacterized protein L201_001971 [Kwoniella dendrophila CBS 6074]|uniref:Uncharacterized protein n=1 Tax=Kwoniella dendrophila CBS 6074 TaxID=1295534 RepID=A0AAX4JNU7_9TREE